jgi:hypothetical protein
MRAGKQYHSLKKETKLAHSPILNKGAFHASKFFNVSKMITLSRNWNYGLVGRKPLGWYSARREKEMLKTGS